MNAELYTVRSLPNGFRMVKFDDLLNVLAVYELKQRRVVHCECFRANTHTCRHREMLEMFKVKKRVNKGWFYNYTTGKWVAPIKQ